MTTNPEMYIKCLHIEALVKTSVLKGIHDYESLIDMVDTQYHPNTPEEMEAYSEAIIYAKFGILN
jgi:hypothetical protein